MRNNLNSIETGIIKDFCETMADTIDWDYKPYSERDILDSKISELQKLIWII